MSISYLILYEIVNKKTNVKRIIDISTIITPAILKSLTVNIKGKQGTFKLDDFTVIQDALGFNIVKGGNSLQKSDILLDISNQAITKINEGFGIKSYLDANLTLLNASGNTYFIFQIENLDNSKIDEINSIDTSTKLKDRITAIESFGGRFKYIGAEKDTMTYNLKMVDSLMPEIIAYVLLAFYKNRISSISKIVDFVDTQTCLNKQINYGDKAALKNKIQKLLVDVLLGFLLELNGMGYMKQMEVLL